MVDLKNKRILKFNKVKKNVGNILFSCFAPKKYMLFREDLEINLMTNVFEAFRFDFTNNNNFPPENKKIEIEAIKKGKSYGIIQWIKLEMGNGLKHENHPANLTKASSWHKVVYVFDDPIELSIGQKVVITAKHNRDAVYFFLEK